MTNPYPIPRAVRQTDVLVGNGGATYGPFDGLKCFDAEDIKVYVRPQGAGRFEAASVTVVKLNGLPFDFFTITFASGLPSTTEYVVSSERVAERSAGVDKGTLIDMTALEKELSKISTVQQELRRDIGRTLRADYGQSGPVLDSDVEDGELLMKQGDRLVKGPNADQVANAQNYSLTALAAAAALIGMTNAVYDFTDEAAFEAANVPAVLTYVTTAGYSSAGDYGGHRKRRIAEPVSPKPWQSQSADGAWWEIEQGDLSPEMFGAKGDDIQDDAPAWRAMIDCAIARTGARMLTCPGKTYAIASPDPEDPGSSLAIYRTGIAANLTFDWSGGATIKGYNGIQPTTNPATIFRLESDGSGKWKIEYIGGRIDLSECTPATAGVTTIGGMSLTGRWNIILSRVVFDHGETAASGEAIGVGGGDQSAFFSNYNSAVVDRCSFLRAPDLGLYLSNSQGNRLRVSNCLFYRCQNAIAFKRFSRDYQIYGNVFLECDVGVYNPTSDGLNNNNGGPGIISNNWFIRTQTRPIDIGALADGTIIYGNRIQDWGRTISDESELALNEQLGGIRVRSRNCQIYGNWIGFKDWVRVETSGKQQISVILSYNGTLAIGAENCTVFGNTFVGTLRGVLCAANTSNNDVYGNSYVNVSNADLDQGTNNLGLRFGQVGGTKLTANGGGDLLLLTANAERLRVNQADGKVGIGAASSSAQLHVQANANPLLTAKNNSGSAVGHMVTIEAARAQNSDFNFLRMISSANGTQDNEFFFRGDGTALADGSWTGGGADYAEYFERSEGVGEDWTGRSIVVEDGFVRRAMEGEEPIGAVSTMPVVVGDAGELRWTGKYLVDDFGRPELEPYQVISWWISRPEDRHLYEVNYPVDGLPEGLEAPPDAEVVSRDEVSGEEIGYWIDPDGNRIEGEPDPKRDRFIPEPRIRWFEEAEGPKTLFISYDADQVPDDVDVPWDAIVSDTDDEGHPLMRRKLNPDFDPGRDYVPRSQRPEWVCVGLKGKLRIYKGEPVGSRWVKLRDISDLVEEWLVL